MSTVECWPNYKYAKHPVLIFQSSTLAAAAQMYRLFCKLRVSTQLRCFSAQLWIATRGKDLLNETGETRTRVKVASCRSGPSAARLHLQRHVLFRRVKIPRSSVPFQAANFASLEDDPGSRCRRDRGPIFCLIPPLSSVNRVPQLVCKSP